MKNIFVLIVSLLVFKYAAIAQYTGGNGDGDDHDGIGPVMYLDGSGSAASKLVITSQAYYYQLSGSINISVEIQDANGNLVPSATNTVTLSLLSNPTGAVLSGTTSVAASEGIAIFGNLSLSELGSGYSFLVSASGLTSDTTDFFDIYETDFIFKGGSGRGDSVGSRTNSYHSYYWLITGTSNFTTGSNWTGGSFPTGLYAYIPPGGTQPVLSSGSQSISSETDIEILPNASLSVNNGATLNVSGYLTTSGTLTNSGTITLNSGSKLTIKDGGISNSGSIQATNGTVAYNGTSPQTISNSLFSGNAVGTLEINNDSGVSMANSSSLSTANLNIESGTLSTGTGTLTISSGGSSTISSGGKLTVNGGGLLVVNGELINYDTITFRSVNNSTAMLGASTGSITNNGNGKVSIERYIPANGTRRYRMLASNLVSYTFSQLIDDIFVTGPSSGVGFDVAPIHTSNPSVYTYQETTAGTGRGWKAVDNINNSLSTGLGAYVFVRGDRTLAAPSWYQAPFATPNDVTTDHIGDVVIGNVSPPVTYTNTGSPANDGYNFVANPYPSPIDWSLITKNNLSAFYYVYNPVTGSTVALSGSSVIASGQGFWVQATSASPSITFTESCKTTNSPANNTYFKSAADPFTIYMIKDSVNSDMAVLRFDNTASPHFNHNEDARKMANSVLNIALFADSQKVQINTVPPSTSMADTFDLSVAAAQGNYQLQFAHTNQIPPGKTLLLRDLFVQSVTPVANNMIMPLQITAANASQGKRYQLILINTNALPVEWLTFSGEQNNPSIKLNWSTAREKNTKVYIVERRKNEDEDFTEIASVKAKGYSNEVNAYFYTDIEALPEAGDMAFYRIKQIDLDGSFSYSNVLVFHRENNISTEKQVRLYPNPAASVIHIQHQDQPINELTITDVFGKTCFISAPGTKEVSVDISRFNQGIYFIRINNTSSFKINKL